ELQGWKLVRVVHLKDDRRDHFETSLDVWELFRTVVRERKEREFDPTFQTLRDCIYSPDFSKESRATQKRLADTLALMETLATWSDQMLRLEPSTLMKLLKLGSSIQKFVRGDTKRT